MRPTWQFPGWLEAMPNAWRASAKRSPSAGLADSLASHQFPGRASLTAEHSATVPRCRALLESPNAGAQSSLSGLLGRKWALSLHSKHNLVFISRPVHLHIGQKVCASRDAGKLISGTFAALSSAGQSRSTAWPKHCETGSAVIVTRG